MKQRPILFTMKKDEIQLEDWERILFGVAPPEFLLETLFRALIIYFVLLVILRLDRKSVV